MANPAEDDVYVLPAPESMSIGELKKELMDYGDPSFVFSDFDELVMALKTARKLNGNTLPNIHKRNSDRKGGSTSSHRSSINNSSSGGGGYKSSMKISVVPEIPTMKEDPEGGGGGGGLGASLGKGIRNKTKLGRRNSLNGNSGSSSSKINKMKRVNPLQAAEEKDESIRLVEYFVMVSSRQHVKKEGEKFPRKVMATRPPDPTKDKLDSRTLSRFDARCAHLDGVGHVDNDVAVRLASIAHYSSMSTSSTCSSEDYELSRHGDSLHGSHHPGFRGYSVTSASSLSGAGSRNEGPSDEVEEVLLEPVITARYPVEDRPDQPLNPMLPQFCHPQGTDIIHPSKEYKMPRIHHFVLTDSKAGKLYGTCLTVYEDFTPSDASEEAKKKKYYAPRVLCLLSTWPYLSAFRTYLTQLYRLATSTDLMEAPIERYVLNLCAEVPAPPPGAFEVQLSIMNTDIRFWAPPAQQPIPYVSLPFKTLFECLDIANIMFAWYTLACERKVLLVSDQLSLLSICAEILCSLLFPMRWSHLYIPVLPRSLSAMLDAPMPYLCGISRENFHYAVPDIGDETVVVDLDRNVITLGSQTPDLPPLPHKRRVKLEQALEKNAGQVFWNARGLTREQAESIRRSGNEAALREMHEKADSLWQERIGTVDEAFNLAHAPDSTSLQYNDDANADAGDAMSKQSRWDAVQEAFLRFYVAMLKEYRKFLPAEAAGDIMASSWRGPDGNSELRFNTDDFVISQRSDFQPFLEELTSTQQFDDFITKRIYNAGNEPDVTFFDKSIEAKKNRSIMKIKKADTTFLHSASAHKELQRYDAVSPNRHGVPASASTKIGSNGHPVYQYPVWPETFDESLFGTPRPIPTNITSEFERRIALKAKLKARTKELRDRLGHDGGHSHYAI